MCANEFKDLLRLLPRPRQMLLLPLVARQLIAAWQAARVVSLKPVQLVQSLPIAATELIQRPHSSES